MRKPNESYVGPAELFLTVTLKPEHHNQKARNQFKLTHKRLNEILKCNTMKYFLVSELTKKGNIHYHVSLKLKDYVFQKEMLIDAFKNHKFFGFIDLQDNVNYSVVSRYEYMSKDLNKTDAIINQKNKVEIEIWTYYVNNRPIEDTISDTEKEINRLDNNISEFDD